MGRGVSKRIRSLLEELKRELAKLYGPRLKELVLFGSYARREARPGSDLDVAMILDDFERTWPEITRTSAVVSDLSLKYDITVSLIPVRERDFATGASTFERNIQAEGIPVS